MDNEFLKRMKQLSPIKQEFLETCLYGIEFIDDNKVKIDKTKKIFYNLYIQSDPISFKVIVDGKDITDYNIEC